MPSGEWILDINTDLSGTGPIAARIEPPPTGLPGVPLVNQEIFYNFVDEREPASLDGLIPVVGNCDPPLGMRGYEPARLSGDDELDVAVVVMQQQKNGDQKCLSPCRVLQSRALMP